MTEHIQTQKTGIFSNPIVKSLVGIAIVALALGGFIFWMNGNGTISIENAEINAPVINLSPTTPGTLNALYVKEGDTVSQNTPVALVGTGIVISKQSGVITMIANNVGAYYNPGTPVVSMVHPEDMTVVGAIDETKGLEEIQPGQKATFTVDAFGGKTYVGVVLSVGQTANDASAVFSISDKRPVKNFNVKVRFTTANYPELKDGMSAKITVYTK